MAPYFITTLALQQPEHVQLLMFSSEQVLVDCFLLDFIDQGSTIDRPLWTGITHSCTLSESS
jgi:hypothetical protein